MPRSDRLFETPPWCVCKQSSASFLVLAPHGGQRSYPSRPAVPLRHEKRHRINDLYSAEVAIELADRLSGSYLVNRGMDRNQLDLNRVRQVRRRASWFLEAIDDLVAAILARHEIACVLVVHGWNVNQSRCDFGVGADLESSADTDTSQLTASLAFIERVLHPLAHPSRLYRTTRGSHFPARHRNNLLQLFRRDAARCSELPERLAAAVAGGRCEAVQVELGIPLRWPGERRTAFVAGLASALQNPAPPPRRAASQHRGATTSTSTGSWQLFDPACEVGILAAVDELPAADRCFGRLALYLPDGSVGLYTGEAASTEHLAIDGPAFTDTEDGQCLRFDGSMMITADGSTYVDLEYALAGSHLQHCRIELAKTRRGDDSVVGSVEIGERRYEVSARGFDGSRWGAWRRAARAQWSVRAALDDGSSAVFRSDGGEINTAWSRVCLAADGYTPLRIDAETSRGRIRVDPRSRMSIVRPIDKYRRARVTFGPADIEIDGRRRGTAIYDYARLVDRP